MTVIDGTTTLTPIASVDTSSSDAGVSMFTLLLDPSVITAGNLFQFEYYISVLNGGLAAVPDGNNFIALEDAVTTQGISNQVTIAVPSFNNVYEPTIALEVKIRAYVATETGISVSTWSNTAPVYNPPERPGVPTAYLVTSGVSNELLYVQIPNNTSYDLNEITFIISYSYTDVSGENQWIVSAPQIGTRYGVTGIIFDSIELDIDPGTPVYVAVNAVFSYLYSGLTYYTVSQISITSQALIATPGDPTLEPIDIPTDYLVYSTPSTQEVVLSWLAPVVSYVPNYEIVSYQIVVTDGTVTSTISVSPTPPLTYTYTIPSTYYAAGTSSSTFSFVVKAINEVGTVTTSSPQTVNTFTYATIPQNQVVVWANSGTVSGKVDMLCTFNNPSNNGQGAVVNIQVQVLNSTGTVVDTRSIPYVAGINPYAVYLPDITTTTTGSVVVYMTNTDTNATTAGGAYVIRNGASSSANYISSDLPFIYDVVLNTTLSFKVLSQTALVYVNQLIGPQVASPYYFGVQFYANPTDSPYSDGKPLPGSYTVSEDPAAGDFVYTFVFDAQWLTNAGLTGNIIIAVANSYGVQEKAVPGP
jgi:hypothetical protein